MKVVRDTSPPASSSLPLSPSESLENIQIFLDATRGQITIGRISPIPFAAIAAEGKTLRAALVGRADETVLQLLQRLDAALDKFVAQGVLTDEVLPEIQRRRGR
jgi:hypothetical protein